MAGAGTQQSFVDDGDARGEAAPAAGPCAEVALNRPVRREFTYRVPPELVGRVGPGARVAVPFGSRREVGVVVALRDAPPPALAGGAARLRPLARLLDEVPALAPELLELTRWIAGYYACSWGEALAAALPAALKRERGPRQVRTARALEGVGPAELAELETKHPKQHRLLRTLLELSAPMEARELLRRLNLSEAPLRSLERRGWAVVERADAKVDPLLAPAGVVRARPERLSDEQERALAPLVAAVEAREYRTFLLQGVTGSGKTEVYLRAIERALALGRGAIVLVPEIALTPQTVSWFRARFGEVAVLHSRMSDAQRLDMWRKLERGDARVVVGARSAVFAPVRDLGVLVVDEEHEPSFKQGSTPRYHGRDVAVVRAQRAGAVCVLGSATPSLETWLNARQGRYGHLVLSARVAGGSLPAIEIVDMRHERDPERPKTAGPPVFSRRLRKLLAEAVGAGRQAILFLNRRGFAPVLYCAACGETARCASCDVGLTWHRRIRRAVCHVCCEEKPPITECPTCTAPGLRYLGSGSERVEAELADALPAARVRRMDSDTMHRREDYEEVLAAFGRGEVDVLVGTQMIAKGLDFPNVTVVGIVSADSALHLPDFRAAERTFQLLAQVSGRAGRGAHPGRIVVQTSAPDHPAVRFAAKHDFEGFAHGEDRLRRELGYPPWGRLIRAVLEDTDAERARAAAERLADLLRDALPPGEAVVLGPAEAPLARLRGRWRWHLLVKAPGDSAALRSARSLLAAFAEQTPRPRVAVDVDPVAML